MKYQSLKKRVSTTSFFLLILLFASLNLESKALYESYETNKEPPLLTCPIDLASFPTPQVVIVQSQCSTVGGIPRGGAIMAPTTACPVGSIFEYATNENPVYTSAIPNYNQTTSLLVNTRCTCIMDSSIFSVINENTTMPADCSVAICDAILSTTTAPLVGVINSTCTVAGGVPSGGVLSVPTIACPFSSSIEYSINNGVTWSTTLPIYSQNTAITVLTRCICDVDNSLISMVGSITTSPGICSLTKTTIPTMSEWGLIIFSLLILNIGIIILYRLERILI